MKLLWISHLVPWPLCGSGVQQRASHLVRQAAIRYEVHLVALNQRALLPDRASIDDARRELLKVCASVLIHDYDWDAKGARWALYTAANFARSTPYDVNRMNNARMHAEIRELCERESPDLVHLDTLGLHPYACQSTPTVLNHHNIESDMMARRVETEPRVLRRTYFRREAAKLVKEERRIAPRCAMNLVVSDLDRDRLKKVSPEARSMTVDNGVDVDYFKSQRPAGSAGDGLVFVGRLTQYPNRNAIEWLLRDIWPLLVADHEDQRLCVVGKHPFPELLDATKDRRITAPGFIDDALPYFDRAAAYVCPIRIGGGTRLKILDALAMSLPLVATGFAVEGLGLSEDEHYLRADEPEHYVAQLRRLREDPDLGRRLAGAGRAHVERHYSWDVIGERLERAYDAALEGE